MIRLVFKYSQEQEKRGILTLLQSISWFKSQGYKYTLPVGFEDEIPKLKNDETLISQVLDTYLSKEYNSAFYEESKRFALSEWTRLSTRTNKLFSELSGIMNPSTISVILTRYGPGGRYQPPNTIIINIALEKKDNVIETIVHEMVHLSIEHLIQQSHIGHWEKERIVDLVMVKNFPELVRLQRDPKNAAEIKKTFDNYYPCIDKIVFIVSEL